MRSSDNRAPLLIAIFMALLLGAIPGKVDAQTTGTPFNAQTCIQNQINAYTAHAQWQAARRAQIFAAAQNPDMKLAYCWTNIQLIIDTIGTLSSAASILGAIIWAAVWKAIQTLLNTVCQAISNAITSAVNMINSLLCVPIPNFNLSANFSLGSFGAGNCNGVSLSPLSAQAVVGRSMPTGYSPMWGYTPTFGQ